MDIDHAMQAHVNWKTRLKEYCSSKRTENLDPNMIGKDNQCELGKWIQGEGNSEYGTLPDFAELKTTHAMFHRSASEIVRLANSNNIPEAQRRLGDPESDFRKKTTQVIGILMRIKLIQKGG